ncbi:RING-H2 finger protein ATL2 [Hirschfeldia incana]|nr:RING-H2 finger protein ATL2 [Hirschfeldia incana]
MNSNDQYPMGRPDDPTSNSRTYAMSGKIMLSAIVILFFVVILMVFLHLYARWYLLRARRRHFRRRSRNRRAATMVFFAADPSTVVASRGLDPAVIKSLPVFAFSESTHKDLLTECAVCLSEFEEGESGRVLPGCKHTFHVDCIDMWFHSHSTCPLCRSLVEAPVEEQQVAITISPEPVSAIEPGSSSGLGDEPPRGSVMPSEDLMRKPSAIEVPRRNFSEFEDDLNRNSPANQSFRSPMSRMLSFTRMLSRGNASSPVCGGAPAQSPSSNCRIAMTESDIERGGEETTR